MSDPLDSAAFRITRQIQRDYEMLQGALGHLQSWERGRFQTETIAGNLPHYYSALHSLSDTLQHGGTAGLFDQIQRGGWLDDSTLGLDCSLARVLADERMLNTAAGRGFGSTCHMLESLNRAHVMATERQLSSDLLAGLGRMQGESAFALGMQARIEEALSGVALDPSFDRLLDRLTTLTDLGERIWARYSDMPTTLIAAPEFLRELPTHLVAAATRSTGLIITADEGFAEEGGGILSAQAGELEERLGNVSPALITLYRGALTAFSRRDDDYIRQVSVSLRELFVHLLRELAPDASIRRWDPAILPQTGKTPYRVRLVYVFRTASQSKAYGRMVKNDIDHVLQNFFLLDGEGVHKLTSDLEHEEVRILIARCEYDLLVMLRAHELSIATDT